MKNCITQVSSIVLCCLPTLVSFGQSKGLRTYLEGSPIAKVVATSTQGVNKPRDLDFNPAINNQLWIANFGSLNVGADMVIINNAGLNNQTAVVRTDESKLHFLNSTSALSFSNNGNFATCGELANSPGDTKDYMGPTLWQTNIFGVKNNNGSSHIDMLHESPFGMGIEAESGNSFWVFDGMNSMICNYDYYTPHEPGGHYHGDAKLARYSEVKVLRKQGVPSHLVRDRSNNWLYIVDGGNKRILRMDISSGSKGSNLSCNEQYTNGCYTMKNVKWEIFTSNGLVEPSGIEINQGILAVSDHSNGDIIFYDTQSSSANKEIGRIKTSTGIMGLKLDKEGKLWYVNNKENTVVRLDFPAPSSVLANSTVHHMSVYPNPAQHIINLNLSLAESSELKITLRDIAGKERKVLYQGYAQELNSQYSIHDLEKGIYLLDISTNGLNTKSQLLMVQ